jgi:hypothetical protein
MAITNYGQLKTAVADWLNRDDMASVIPTFIDLAHARVNRVLRVADMVQRTETQLDSRFTQVPADFLQMRAIQLRVTPTKALEFLTAEQIIQERSRLSDTAREPMFYSILGDTIEVMPTPDATYELEISYYQDIPSMSADSDTNWLLTKAPGAYLYGALIESAPYLAEDQRGLVWHELYNKCIEELTLEDEKSRFSGSTPIARHRSL